ncbi:MAG: hypothetical protein QOF37_3019 [Thermoleophilaceae bacterium]|nr:hypothetical protein [Thermoleophilaceae bacterium]
MTDAAPGYELKVGGAPVPAAILGAIRTIEVEDHADLADMLRLQLTIGVRDDGEAWTGLDDALFTRLAEVQVAATLPDGRALALIKAYVVDVRTHLSPAPGASTMEVVAMDASVLMSLEEKVRAWPDQSDSSIASTIFSEHGLSANVHDSQPTRRQNELTTIQREHDMAFVKRLAARNGYEFYVEVDDSGQVSGHFHPPSLDEPEQGVLSVNLGPATNVDSFQARYDMMAAATADVRGLEVGNREVQPAQATSNEQPVLGAEPALPSDRPRKVLLAGTGLSEGGELQTLAQAVTERSSFAVSAEGELNGAAYGDVLRAKKPVLVRGAGQSFSGRYYVERVTHQFSGEGWIQRFKLKRNAAGVASRDSFRQNDALPPQQAVQA